MSHALAFDTLVYANKLKKAGFTEQQAETQAEALAEVVDNNLATKHDLKKLEVSLKHDIELVRRDIKELELTLKHDLTIRFGGMLAVTTGILAVLMKIL